MKNELPLVKYSFNEEDITGICLKNMSMNVTKKYEEIKINIRVIFNLRLFLILFHIKIIGLGKELTVKYLTFLYVSLIDSKDENQKGVH